MTPTTQKFIIGNNLDPVDDEINAQRAVAAADWWTRCNLTESWPVSTDEAVQLLAEAGEYDIDAESLLELAQRNLIPRPVLDDSDACEWSASDVVGASGVLESRQQWRATPSAHDPKKHVTQLLLEHARANNEVELIVSGSDQARFDLRHLLELLVQSGSHEGRRKILSLLKATLEVDHGVIV